MNNNRKGKLIVFEGIDGTGKSTQIQLLAEKLLAKGYDTVVTREPTDGIFGKKIRQHFLERSTLSKEEELQLFLDDRMDHLQTLLHPALEKGQIVLCDRYFLSTAAYQGAIGFDPQTIVEQNNFAPVPDLALILQLSPEESIRRITSYRGDNLNDFEQKENLEKVQQIFDNMKYPYIRRVNALQNIEQVHREICSLVKTVLKLSIQTEIE